MSSKEEILAKIRRHASEQVRYEKPVLEYMNRITYTDKLEQFCAISRAVGGAAVVLGQGEDVNAVIRRTYPDAVRIASVLPEISCATFNPDMLDDPRELDGTDVAVVKGEIGVAENGAIWIPQEVKHKALYFISETLVILLDRNRIVDTMYDAYRELDVQQYGFGTFISGPSKTADIEQALVMGAHGARDVLVILR
ncbi:LUD domain-containing protein [uncultured Bacteroides sp.]|uniref:LutC/YkgG family protein n=1 Tax=uncultured Bacteroides sp. TaxID=162156 RepID=UPI0025DAABD0|nr:LUD domain-containing protein [uncultured Bacteroides sp.]